MKKLRQPQYGLSFPLKFSLKMRLTLLCLLLPLLGLQAKTSFAQKVITIAPLETTVSELLETIENNTDYRFVYKVEDVELNRKINIRAYEEAVPKVLDKIFKDTNVFYELIDDQIFLVAKERSSALLSDSKNLDQDDIKVTGSVTDDSGVPIPGVNILVKGTSRGTTSDFDGNFEIEIEAGQTLIFSSVGYEEQSRVIDTAGEITVVMQEGSALDEVVVVGFGTTRKEDLSTSVSSVKVTEVVKSGQSDLNTVLQGRLPGVTIQSAGGDPMFEGTISIRGRGSRGSEDDPSSGDGVLYVVDGVPNAPFNVADIESVSILKDAASAAIYGATVGSGGVIEITTKRAASGEPRISFNTYQGIKRVTDLPGTLTSEQYNEVWGRAIADRAPNSTATLPMVADPNRYPYGNVTRTDWLEEIFRDGYQQHYDVSITGGTDRLKALASFAYDKNEGTLINTFRESFNGRINLDFQVNDWIKLSENVDYEHSNGQGGINNNTHEGVIMNAYFYPRSATIYEFDENGNQLFDQYGNIRYGGTIPQYMADQGVSGYGEIRNPVATLNRLRQYRPSSRVLSTTKLEITPVEDLVILSRYTTGVRNSREESFFPRVLEIGLPKDENERRIFNSQGVNWQWETTASYDKRFDRHRVDALVGFNMSKENFRSNLTSVFEFDKEDRHSTILPAGDNWSKNKPDESIWDESTTSVFGRIGYSFDNRYFLTASLRRDATSKLFKDNNSGVFPAVSGSWKISSEPFFQGVKENLNIDLFKIRGSWGQIGNIKLVPRYSYDAPLAFPGWPYILGQGMDREVYGVYQQTLSNPNLKWETTQQTGFGLDWTMFNRSLDISVDYFHKTTKDLIEQLPPPSVAGVEVAPYENVGKVLNKGWEFSLAYNKSIGELDMNIWGNFNTVKNEVLNIGPRGFMSHDVTMNSMKPMRSAVGQPWYSYFVIETDGIFQNQAEIDAHVNSQGIKIQPDAVPGDIKFVDKDDNGRINDDDRVFKGSYLPKFTYAFGSSFQYKGFDLSLMFQGISGNKIFNGFKQMGMTGRDSGNNMLSEVLNSWNYNKDSGLPRLSIAGDDNDNYGTISDFLVESGSYLRLKNLVFGYTFSKDVMETLGLGSGGLRIYFSAENLFTITPYSGINPEVGNFGLDGGTYPVPQSFSLGLNLNL